MDPVQTTICDLIKAKDYHQLVAYSEDAYLMADSTSTDESKLAIASAIVLGYLVLDDLSPARYALSRLALNIRQHPLIQALYDLLASTFARKYESIYPRAQKVASSVSKDTKWPEPLIQSTKSLVAEFLEVFRQMTARLLAKAYAAIPASKASKILGVAGDDLIVGLQATGWSYDKRSKWLVPPKVVAQSAFSGANSSVSTLSTFKGMSHAAGILELSHS